MKGLAFFTLFLIVFGCYAEQYNAVMELVQIRRSSFGRTLLETIQLELNAGGNSVDGIKTILNKMSFDIGIENQTLEEENEKAKAKCIEDINAIDFKITEYKNKIASNLESIKVIDAEVDNLTPAIADDEKVLPSKYSSLKQVEEGRKAQKAAYDSAKATIAQYRAALLTAKNKFQTLQMGSNNNVAGSMLLEIKEVVSNLGKGKFLGFLNIFTNFLQNEQIISDQDKVGRVIVLIDKLTESLRNDENTLDQTEQQNYNSYLTTKSNLETEINLIETRLKNNKDRLREILNQKNSLLLENEELGKNILLKEEEKSAVNKSCNDRETQYQIGKGIRKEQLSIIAQALAIFEDPQFSNQTIQTLKNQV